MLKIKNGFKTLGRSIKRPFRNKLALGDNNQETTGLGKIGNWLIFVIILVVVCSAVYLFTSRSKSALNKVDTNFKQLEDMAR